MPKPSKPKPKRLTPRPLQSEHTIISDDGAIIRLELRNDGSVSLSMFRDDEKTGISTVVESGLSRRDLGLLITTAGRVLEDADEYFDARGGPPDVEG